MHEVRVTDALSTHGSRDTSNPQGAEFTLPHATVSSRKGAGTNQRLLYGSQQLAATTEVTPSFLEQTLL
jgi:hypothetical protein